MVHLSFSPLVNLRASVPPPKAPDLQIAELGYFYKVDRDSLNGFQMIQEHSAKSLFIYIKGLNYINERDVQNKIASKDNFILDLDVEFLPILTSRLSHSNKCARSASGVYSFCPRNWGPRPWLPSASFRDPSPASRCKARDQLRQHCF